MNALFIDPFFVTNKNAISYHTQIFFEAISEFLPKPLIVGMRGEDNYKNDHSFIQVEPRSLKYINAFFNRSFPDITHLPDNYCWEIKDRFIHAILKNVDLSRIDFIHSFSNPHTAHLIAYEIHKKTNIPWIAQLYDPWTDNPYRQFKTSYYRRRDQDLEALVALNAAAIIHTNHIMLEKWNERYGEAVKGKSFVLPMSYTRDRYLNASSVPNVRKKDTIIVSYVGKLFFDRDLSDVIRAISLIKGEKYNKKLLIRIIGEIEHHDLKMIRDYKCEDYFEIIPYQAKDKLIDYYYESDAFLLIESPQKENVFFPSKLLDYFIFQRPIIGITPVIGETTNLLKQSNNIAVENGDYIKLKKAFQTLLNDVTPVFDKEYYKHFSPARLSTQYKEVVSYILSKEL